MNMVTILQRARRIPTTILAASLLLLSAAPGAVAGGILTGGAQVGTGFETMYTAPGTQQFFQVESDGQMVFPGGTLKNLRVSVKDAGQPAGTVTVRLRVNGAATQVVCSITNFGTCTSTGTKVIKAGDLVAVLVRQTFGAGNTLRMNYLFELE